MYRAERRARECCVCRWGMHALAPPVQVLTTYRINGCIAVHIVPNHKSRILYSVSGLTVVVTLTRRQRTRFTMQAFAYGLASTAVVQ